MIEIAKTIKKLRALDHTGRWEMHPHLKYESVSQHSFWVATFTAVLADKLERDALVLAAVTHDWEESITSDLPALVKARIPAWATLVKVAEAELFSVAAVGTEEIELIDALQHAREIADTNPTVKLADLFSALMYAQMEVDLGNVHYTVIRKELIGSIVKLAAKQNVAVALGKRAIALLHALGFDINDAAARIESISHL